MGTPIIFLNNWETAPQKIHKNPSGMKLIKMHLSVPPEQLPLRIISSLIPPIWGKNSKKIYIDLLGPILAILSMASLLYYGHISKMPHAILKISPTEMLLIYGTLMPIFSYMLGKLGQSRITFIELLSILGYSLFGHVFTLIVSLFFYQENSNLFFFLCLLIFGGLSTLRIVLILVQIIPKPGLRFVVCSFVSIIQLLFLVFVHFAYMHRSFVYGKKH